MKARKRSGDRPRGILDEALSEEERRTFQVSGTAAPGAGRKHFPAIRVFALPSRLNPYKSAFVIGHQEPIVEMRDAGRRWLGTLLRTVAR